MASILLTGGAGYIGAHAAVQFMEAGFDVVIIDNLCNSSVKVIDRIEAITGRRPLFHHGDVRSRADLKRVFTEHAIDAVVHFAGLKVAPESIEQPLRYYDNNVCGSVTLLDVMQQHGCRKLVFSSTANVYGEEQAPPVREDAPLAPGNPYGRSKLMAEQIMQDAFRADGSWSIALLRYFNPAGAHASGLIGEDPRGTPQNLMPYVAKVAAGRLPVLSVFGDDYPTHDGTGVRDFIHVVDLADGHLAALRYIAERTGVYIWNLGTGQGYSVLDMVKAFERASGRPVPYRVAARRPRDIPVSFADPSKAEREMGWRARRGLDVMCEDLWRWQGMNPDGYGD